MTMTTIATHLHPALPKAKMEWQRRQTPTLGELLAGPQLRLRMARAARDRVWREFSPAQHLAAVDRGLSLAVERAPRVGRSYQMLSAGVACDKGSR
jgi:hypothetical protein